jgi:hypothetical protein
VPLDKNEGVVKRHLLTAMLSSTTWISERWRTEALKLSPGAPGSASLPGCQRVFQTPELRRGGTRIRINDQYRVCFEWRDGNAYDVEIVDYH